MDNKHETEEELRARLKEELKAELLEELKADKVDKKDNNFKATPNSSGVKISKSTDKGVKDATDLLNRDKKFDKGGNVPKMRSLPQAKDESNTLTVIIIIVSIILIGVSYFFLPKIYKWFNREQPSSYVDPNADKEEPKDELEKITLESDIVKNLTYPIMRNNLHSTNSYYKRSVLNVGDLSNNDIIYNTFVHIYKGNIAEYTGTYGSDACVSADMHKTFNAKYIEARMNNLFTKSVEFEHSDFTVPATNTMTPYIGTWKYDSLNHRYIYYGNCDKPSTSTTNFYDLKYAYDAKGLDNNNVIEVYYDIAFARVNTKTSEYTIFKDANYKEQILNGQLTSTDYENELNQIFADYIEAENVASKYKFTFSNTDCSYQNHCFIKGEWLEEN